MSSPVVQEFWIGVLGGFLTLPAFFLLWPIVALLTRGTIDHFGYGVVTSMLGGLWLILVGLAVVGIPMVLSSWLMSIWHWKGMEVEAALIRGRVFSASAMVYFIGALASWCVVVPLRKLPVVDRLYRRWDRWLDGLYQGECR